MELVIQIDNRSSESDISRIIKYLKAQSCVNKFDVVTDDFKTVTQIADKTTINAIHTTSSKALSDFLESEAIF